MIPLELLTLFDSLEFEEGGWIIINSCNWINKDLHVELQIKSGPDEFPEQLWELIIENIKEESIKNASAYSIEEYDEHPLLLEFNDTYADLYSNSIGESHDKLVVDLAEMLSEKFKDWIPLDKYLNKSSAGFKRFRNIFDFKTGLIAKGPLTILKEYETVLKNNKKDCNILILENYKRDFNWKQRLLIIGDSYFIGKDFKYQRIK